jgi:hypothetical protein
VQPVVQTKQVRRQFTVTQHGCLHEDSLRKFTRLHDCSGIVQPFELDRVLSVSKTYRVPDRRAVQRDMQQEHLPTQANWVEQQVYAGEVHSGVGHLS